MIELRQKTNFHKGGVKMKKLESKCTIFGDKGNPGLLNTIKLILSRRIVKEYGEIEF